MRRMSRSHALLRRLRLAALATAWLWPAAAWAASGADCLRFGLIARTMQADYLAGRSFQQARQDGLNLLGPEHPRQALIVEQLARGIYTSPDSRGVSAQARALQVQAECLQAAAQAH